MENDQPLTEYLIRHNQIASLSSFTHLHNENLPMPETDEQECDSPVCLQCACCGGGQNESSSSSDDENELSPYDRLQRCLQPILSRRIFRSFELINRIFLDVNYTTTLPSQTDHEEEEQHFREISRIFAAFEDSSDDEISSNNRRKLCCFVNQNIHSPILHRFLFVFLGNQWT